MQLRDLKDMPTKGEPPKNGMDSVSRGFVILKADSVGTSATPHCTHMGAMLNVGPGIWRSPECNFSCGAWWE